MRADYVVANGVFIALSYHMDGVVYSLIYDSDRKVCVSEIGPILKYIEEFELDSPKLLGYYGEKVRDALVAFKETQDVEQPGLLRE